MLWKSLHQIQKVWIFFSSRNYGKLRIKYSDCHCSVYILLLFFLLSVPCLFLSLFLPSSGSVHLSSSLCGLWFVSADDEFVYEWRELISPEWSFSLFLLLLLFSFSTFLLISPSNQSKPPFLYFSLKPFPTLQGASPVWHSDLIPIKLEGSLTIRLQNGKCR